MKTFRTILLTILGFMTLFATVSCTEGTVLDDLLKATANLENTATAYTEDSLTADDALATSVSYEVEGYSLILLDETVDNPLITFNELRLELISLHDDLVDARESIRTYAESIRASVTTLKEMDYVLLEEDRDFIVSQIDLLKTMRDEIIATQGQAYQRIYDLRGTYTRENLPYIITVYQDVKDVLTFRLETLQSSLPIFAGIDNLLKEYLEN